MGAQPATPPVRADARPRPAPTPRAPTSTIVAPAVGATVSAAQPVTITGTATDTGGKVGAVEVSVDNGAHLASGHAARATWSFTWTPSSDGTLHDQDQGHRRQLTDRDPLCRADRHGGDRTPPPPGTCPCSVWPRFGDPGRRQRPGQHADRGGGEVPGQPERLDHRDPLLQGGANTGTHVGSLWTSTGTRLGTVTFSGESASGWQQASFSGTDPRDGRHDLRRLVQRTRRSLRGRTRATSPPPRPRRAADGPA